VNVRSRWLTLQFDDIINERVGGGTLASYFLISPATSPVEVRWHRERLDVGLKRGWRRNTTYTVLVLPGLSDLRNNIDTTRHAYVFSTGTRLDSSHVRGIVFDWITARPAANAVIRAVHLPDSVAYLTTADSIGRFDLRHVPAGRYLLLGIIDQNRNRVLDPREAFDSATVALRDSVTRELLAFVRDTLGPAITTVTTIDSLRIRVAFDKPLDTAFRILPTTFSVKSRDSALVAIAAAQLGPAYEKEHADSLRARAARDSVRAEAAADSARRARGQPPPAAVPPRRPAPRDTLPPPPKPSVPSPAVDVVIRFAAPLKPGSAYRVTATNVRSLLRVVRTSERVFQTQRATPTDSLKRPAPRPGEPVRR
jgi:hypothetical protein